MKSEHGIYSSWILSMTDLGTKSEMVNPTDLRTKQRWSISITLWRRRYRLGSQTRRIGVRKCAGRPQPSVWTNGIVRICSVIGKQVISFVFGQLVRRVVWPRSGVRVQLASASYIHQEGANGHPWRTFNIEQNVYSRRDPREDRAVTAFACSLDSGVTQRFP